MGRRRKKSNPRRRSLLFEESPVQNHLLVLSPVACADNPVTAVSVPIDGDCTIPWVSPQFDGIAASCGKRRQARRRPSAGNIQGNRSSKENCGIGQRGRHGKFPALLFVGNVAKSAQKTARSGKLTECTENGHVLSVSGEAKSKKRRNCDRSVFRDDLSHSNCEDYGCAETVRRRNSLPNAADKHRPSLARCSVYKGRSSCSPSDSSVAQLVPSVQAKRTRASSEVYNALPSEPSASVCEEEENLHQASRERRGARSGEGRKGYNSDLLLSPLETSGVSGGHTPVTTPIMPIPLRVALFAPSPSEEACNTSADPCLPFSLSQNDRLTCSASQGTNSAIRSRGKAGRPSHSKQAVKGETLRRSQRLQDKVKEALGYLHPGTPKDRSASQVLVTDTPESEYSLCYRQRQRLKGKQKST